MRGDYVCGEQGGATKVQSRLARLGWLGRGEEKVLNFQKFQTNTPSQSPHSRTVHTPPSPPNTKSPRHSLVMPVIAPVCRDYI